jgi:hypothetical protein
VPPEDGKPRLITIEGKSTVVSAGDVAMQTAALTGQGCIQVTPDMIEELARAARATHDHFSELALKIMTPERAAFVRQKRVEEGYTWRAVAGACFEEKWTWLAEDAESFTYKRGDVVTWGPPDNQLMGIALCETAAKFFKDEDAYKEPWN